MSQKISTARLLQLEEQINEQRTELERLLLLPLHGPPRA